MEQNINAYCAICGTGYHVCNSCLKESSFKPWRTVTDTMEHYKIYLALHEYTLTGDKNRGNAYLKSCDLSDLNAFLPEIKKVIGEIRT